MGKLNIGDKAPEFTLESTSGERISLADYRGKNVVLYFYPKDDTPGCTVEACEFRDNHKQFDKADTMIFGVSPDDVKSHQKFTAKFNLSFPLLADVDKKVSEAYGVWVEKSMYGRSYMGVARTTFVIGKDGKITKIFEKVKPEGHNEEVLSALKGLK